VYNALRRGCLHRALDKVLANIFLSMSAIILIVAVTMATLFLMLSIRFVVQLGVTSLSGKRMTPIGPAQGDSVIYLFVVASGFYLFGLLFAAFQYWNLRNQTNPHRAAVLTERIARLNERLNIQQ
jgi:hypothetical protein